MHENEWCRKSNENFPRFFYTVHTIKNSHLAVPSIPVHVFKYLLDVGPYKLMNDVHVYCGIQCVTRRQLVIVFVLKEFELTRTCNLMTNNQAICHSN